MRRLRRQSRMPRRERCAAGLQQMRGLIGFPQSPATAAGASQLCYFTDALQLQPVSLLLWLSAHHSSATRVARAPRPIACSSCSPLHLCIATWLCLTWLHSQSPTTMLPGWVGGVTGEAAAVTHALVELRSVDPQATQKVCHLPGSLLRC